MSFGFFGIQFGWGLQMANMSPIYEKLGAKPDELALLWLAAPMTGLLIQPVIGALSDRTWTRLGRRRPYFLIGAVLASVALLLMPNSPNVRMAAVLLWILDSSNNISMEPFRAFVADKLNVAQRTTGFVMQSFFIGLGASLANAMPLILTNLGITGKSANGVPLAVTYSFQAGAAVYLLAVLWTIFTSNEYPPEDLEAFQKERSKEGLGGFIGNLFKEIFEGMAHIPEAMWRLAAVQFFTWLGLFCMWIFFGPTVARHVFGASGPESPLYDKGTSWAGFCFSIYSIVCFAVAFALPPLASRIGRKAVHAGSLVCGGLGLLSVYVIHDQQMLLLTMVGVGIAWASILSMPYAILAGALPPERLGLYMGIFNFFIVIPEILASLTFQPLVEHVFHNNPLYVVMLGGASMLVAALLVVQVKDEG
ncbi:MAG: MFS transporter [Blastocatellia bacterium]|nr:MFS transporter [Blastocatellia bacterium]